MYQLAQQFHQLHLDPLVGEKVGGHTGRVVTHWPIPVVVHRGALVLLGLIVTLAAAFSLIYCVGAGRAYPDLSDVLQGLAAALIWPVAAVLHECGHAVTGAMVGRPPVWARIGSFPVSHSPHLRSSAGPGSWYQAAAPCLSLPWVSCAS